MHAGKETQPSYLSVFLERGITINQTETSSYKSRALRIPKRGRAKVQRGPHTQLLPGRAGATEATDQLQRGGCAEARFCWVEQRVILDRPWTLHTFSSGYALLRHGRAGHCNLSKRNRSRPTREPDIFSATPFSSRMII